MIEKQVPPFRQGFEAQGFVAVLDSQYSPVNPGRHSQRNPIRTFDAEKVLEHEPPFSQALGASEHLNGSHRLHERGHTW